jgi:hypothetical protein
VEYIQRKLIYSGLRVSRIGLAKALEPHGGPWVEGRRGRGVRSLRIVRLPA